MDLDLLRKGQVNRSQGVLAYCYMYAKYGDDDLCMTGNVIKGVTICGCCDLDLISKFTINRCHRILAGTYIHIKRE